jgi:hypothetical protein
MADINTFMHLSEVSSQTSFRRSDLFLRSYISILVETLTKQDSLKGIESV